MDLSQSMTLILELIALETLAFGPWSPVCGPWWLLHGPWFFALYPWFMDLSRSMTLILQSSAFRTLALYFLALSPWSIALSALPTTNQHTSFLNLVICVNKRCKEFFFFQISLILLVKFFLFCSSGPLHPITQEAERFSGEETCVVTLIYYSVQCNTVL